jgi:predicted transcriptional regulator
MLSVLDYAYLRKAQQHPNYSTAHEKILLILMHQRRHYTKEELLCITNHNEKKLDKTLQELEEIGTIIIEGWLVRLTDMETLVKEIIGEMKR